MRNSIAEARENFEVAKTDVKTCRQFIIDLQKKCDSLQESLPERSREIENAERAKTSALDAFVLDGDERRRGMVKGARVACEEAQKILSETEELLGASERGLKRQESELVRLNEACSQAKRAVWTAIADEIQKGISADVITAIQKLIICRTQTGGTHQYVLNTLLPQLNPAEYQDIRDNLMGQYEIID